MRLAIIGQTGQLARALIARCADREIEAQSYSRTDCDLSSNASDIEEFIDSLNVDAVIIAAAYTAVDAAQEDYAAALAINGHAPAAIAKACTRRGIALVHVSTDYVFNGTATAPYTVNSKTDPVNAYGRSKLFGEQAVLNEHKRASVLRTSWVFDGIGHNFMTTMLRLGQTREAVSVVADQIGRPTFAGHLADACLTAANALLDGSKDAGGIYHVTGSGAPISWAKFAEAIFTRASKALPHAVTITPIPSSEYPTPAPRPAYSVLDLTRFEQRFHTLPDWREGLEQAYKEWAANKN